MNQFNYGSLEACQRLHNAKFLNRRPEIGARVSVDCEGDIHEGFVINKGVSDSEIEVRFDNCEETSWMEHWEVVVLHSIAEVWREFKKVAENYEEMRNKVWDALLSENPTDALINLLIWVRIERGE